MLKSSAPGLVLRAYRVSEYDDRPERVLVDCWGGVFAPGAGGWCQSQGCRFYTFTALPGERAMWNSNELWDFWWESKAWNDETWGWLHSVKERRC
jgi:hypothetical protein